MRDDIQQDLFGDSNTAPRWLRCYWGKTNRKSGKDLRYHLLAYHNLDVAACACVILEHNALLRYRLAEELGVRKDALVAFVTLLIAWHDVGKYAAAFQNDQPKLRAELGSPATDRKYGKDGLYHDTLGYLFWRDLLHKHVHDEDWFGIRALDDDPEKDDPAGAWEYIDPIAQAVTGHHGTPPNYAHHFARRHFKETKDDALAYARAVYELLDELLKPEVPFFDGWTYDERVPRAQRASWLLAGLTILADWIGSNAGTDPSKHYFRFKAQPIDLGEYWQHAVDQAREAVARAGITPASASGDGAFGTLFPELGGYEPTPMQEYALTCNIGEGPHLFILEDLTGSGKTEAALILSQRLMKGEHAQGMYLGLPTMATANAMLDRLVKLDSEDQPYRRFFAEPDDASVVLAHSRSSFQKTFRSIDLVDIAAEPAVDENEDVAERGRAQCAAWLADNRKKALLASVGVGTIDQALVGVLPSRHQSLRLFGLGTKVLIVDEVHAYDEYMSHLLENLLRFQAALGGSAILLSATLTQQLRQRFTTAFREGILPPEIERGYRPPEPVALSQHGFPLATHLSSAAEDAPAEQQVEALRGAAQEVSVKFFDIENVAPTPKKTLRERAATARQLAENDVCDRLLKVATAEGCACWIRNTVDDAREAYERLWKEAPVGVEVRLLHSQFALDDRLRIEEEVLEHFGKDSTREQRSGQILVATQVVEQSLDLDFDYMVSDLAPVDLLIQRAGRLHRHQRDFRPEPASTPKLGILAPTFEDDPVASWFAGPFPKAQYVYPHAGWLWRTVKVLCTLGKRIDLLDDEYGVRQARLLLETVYAPEDPQHEPAALASPFVRDEPDAWRVPSGLREATNEALNEMKRARAEAGYNELHLDGGYGGLKAGAAHWQSEKRTPTRLGEPTTTVRLTKWDAETGTLIPLCVSVEEFKRLREQLRTARKAVARPDAGKAEADAVRDARNELLAAWTGSELSVRQYHVADEPSWGGKDFKQDDDWPSNLRRIVDKTKEAMPDACRWAVPLVLKPNGDAKGEDVTWTGFAKGQTPDGTSKKKQVTYHHATGLQVKKS